MVSPLLKANATSKLDQVAWALSKQVVNISDDGDAINFLSNSGA